MRNSPDPSTATWRKSTYSGGGGNECLEMADTRPTLVRDSKNPRGPVLTFRPRSWTAFVQNLKHPAH
ncbi:DUF397 domain-containing protein [Streptomyces sediminimaris]|uniref:DUF397 domain-containing protein n=1 Tax=Streptomyces sediminimaris TaxID=3383721 RepID=UPI00399B6D09